MPHIYDYSDTCLSLMLLAGQAVARGGHLCCKANCQALHVNRLNGFGSRQRKLVDTIKTMSGPPSF
jgi:hypothetical protein